MPHANTDAGEERILIVPHAPGPLIDPALATRRRAPDEIDDAIDELFGPDPGGAPGWFDLCLVAGGLALIGLSVLRVHSLALTVVGIAVALLGLVLPLRHVWGGVRHRRADRRRRSLAAKGYVLDVSDPLLNELAVAYGELLASVDATGASFRADAVSAAHSALTESVALVAGGTPATPDEAAYVEKRIVAIRDLARAVERQGVAEQKRLTEQLDDERTLERSARRLAGEELDTIGLSSLRELTELTQLVNESASERRT